MHLSLEGNTIKITFKNASRKEKMQAGTTEAHINNMILGAQHNHVYKLKICASHFPMTAAVSGDTFTIKNFLGEKIPRTTKIEPGVKVTVEAPEITVEGADIEKTGIVAARIEQLTKIAKRDIRIFQDGIYMTKKPKKDI
jgi:large subunit ribosomal protein L6